MQTYGRKPKMSNNAAGDMSQISFDQYTRQAEFIFKPHSGRWRLCDFFELLVACRCEEALIGVRPSTSKEGGIIIPRTKARIGSANAEFRFGLFCGEMPWVAARNGQEDWIDEMPASPRFGIDSFKGVAADERVVRIFAVSDIEPNDVQGFMQALIACGHDIHQTVGFNIIKEQVVITGTTKVPNPRHKHVRASFGIQAASACAMESAKEKARRKRGAVSKQPIGLAMDRSAKHRPAIARNMADAVHNRLDSTLEGMGDAALVAISNTTMPAMVSLGNVSLNGDR